MAESSLALNEDFNKCFNGLLESFEQNITSINNLKKEVEKLKANLETRVATDIIQYPGGLELLEGHSAAARENITLINELKKEVEKLKANLETRVATDIIHYPVGQELLEGHSAAASENITLIKKLKKEVEKLKANLETRVATDIIHYPVGLELLEGHSSAARENITRIGIALPNNIKIGPWGGRVRSSFVFGRNSSRITRVDLYTRTLVDGLEIHRVADRDEVKTFRVGGYGGPSTSIWLN